MIEIKTNGQRWWRHAFFADRVGVFKDIFGHASKSEVSFESIQQRI
ncbi:MAG: hypothetical protein P4L44_07240 [Oryzomonas sp.]|nr:hypothetical protein [Oryzomonas sp.]MDR3579738.1 hypothetical protein [Oryzomonas sp.]